jgi:hypothetical protein
LDIYWIITGSAAFFASFTPLPQGSRSDFEPWLLALLGIMTFILGSLCTRGSFYLFKAAK